jgi:hypothetical protein
MWEAIQERLPSGMVLLCAVLSAVIPSIIYYVNKKLHELGDPPWVQEAGIKEGTVEKERENREIPSR